MTPPIEGLVLLDNGSRWVHFTDPIAIIETACPGDVLSAIREVQAEVRARGCHALGFLRYEAGEACGLRVRAAASADDGLPLMWFALFDASSARPVDRPCSNAPYELGPLEASVSRAAFLDAVRTVKQHIADGDTYQVNYTFRLRCDFHGDPLSLFADLVETQRGRHAAFIRFGHHAVCSASPELFFSYADTELSARPMKGTARRGRTVAEDGVQSRALQASLKERAENVMVVDMVRNDLGRVATLGSVHVSELFALEPYPNVWQMTSRVSARSTASLDEVLSAVFPSASVTGAPKVRTMEIIAALEREPRGVYTGTIGYVAPDGSAQFNVAIRTAVVDTRAGTMEFGVGSGIVWDSDPEQEYEECLLKGSILGRRPRAFDLLETMRWTPEEGIYLLDRHLARLEESARYFGFRCPLSEIRDALGRAVASAQDPLRIRLLVSPTGGFHIEQGRLEPAAGIVRVRVAERPIDRSNIFLFHKTTARDVYVEARRADCEDVILWNTLGDVTESTVANLVVDLAGHLVTPPVSSGLLAGTMRADLLAAGEVTEAPVTLAQLREAHAFWLVNSVRGWRQAVLVDN